MRHMALHDPDSSVQEKALALKYGRQKKIQIIDGHQGHTPSHNCYFLDPDPQDFCVYHFLSLD
jgi:hypothetical protein